jgi:hypothetical protein
MKTSNPDHPIRNTLKHLAVALAFALGAGSAQAQIIEVGGAGTIGATPLTTAQVPATPGGMEVTGKENGEAGFGKRVSTIADGDVTLTFTHTYQFEEGFDFGAVILSVNGGRPPVTSISNGFESEPGGTGVWWAPQGFWSDTPKTVTSVMNLGNWPAGTSMLIRFAGVWDGSGTLGPPAWVINTVKVTDGGANDLIDVNFATDGPSGLIHYDIWNPDRPANQWKQQISNPKFEINADTLAADQYSLPSALGTVIDLNNAKLSVVLLSGTLDPGDTFALFDLSSGTTLTGDIASISLPIGTWDTTNLKVNGTITYSGLPATPACPLGVLKLTANGGINPVTDAAWALGDTYRLAFVTSSATPVTSTDITTYNTFVQGVAAASTTFPNLGDGTWNVLGCTADVNARTNTGTTTGYGESVLLMDGTTVWATRRADIWNGIPERAPGQWLAPYMNENGVDVGNVSVLTGMTNDGSASDPLGNANVQYGNTGGGGDNDDWTMVYNVGNPASGRVYALSAPITLVAATGSTDDFTSWATTNGATGQTADQDHDNDGVENGVEYFMGQTGSSFTAMPGLDATNTIIWPASATYEGTYEVQTSPDLTTWTNVSPKPVPSGGNLSYTLPTGSAKLFLRLLVTPAP